MLHARESYNKRIQDSADIIPTEEPVFLLRGQDKLAPLLLDMYIAMTFNEEEHDTNIVDAVKRLAAKMRDWQRIHGCKIADMDPDDNFFRGI